MKEFVVTGGSGDGDSSLFVSCLAHRDEVLSLDRVRRERSCVKLAY